MENLRICDSETAIFEKFEVEDLTVFKQYIEEYLELAKSKNNSCCELVNYLENAKSDDVLLKNYLQGRKYKVDYAWETLRHYVENRFVHYPELFLEDKIGKLQDNIRPLFKDHLIGILKHRDKFGRIIGFFDTTKWDPNVYSMDDLTLMGVIVAEKFWRTPEILEKGVVVLENAKGFGIAHAKQHTMQKVQRVRNVFLHSFPVNVKGIYYLNMHPVFTMVFKMTKFMFPKKIKSRMFLYSTNQIPTDLYDIASPDVLPTWAGGKLSIEEAAEDISYFESA